MRVFALVCGVVACVAVIIIVTLLLTQKRRNQNDGEEPPATVTISKPCLAVIKSDGCHHCTALMPLIETMQKDGVDIRVVEGETLSASWHRKNKVTGYPTICILNNDNEVMFTHSGARTKEMILAFRDDKLSENGDEV